MGYDIRQGSPDSQETTRLVRRYRWRRWSVVFVLLVILVVLSGTTTWIRDGLEKPLVVNDQLGTADVIIVLGSGTSTTDPDHLPNQAKQRVLEGLRLLSQHLAPRIIVSGGQDANTGLVEADAMASFAAKQGGTPPVIEENQSKDTFENAEFSVRLMHNNGWGKAIVVTSPYHTWRACQIFRHQRATVSCVPAPYSLFPANTFADHLGDTKSVVREYGAIVYNWFKGQL